MTRTTRVRFAAGTLATIAASCMPAAAEAGTYTVVACEAAAGVNRSWIPVADSGMRSYARCPSRGLSARGLVMRNNGRPRVIPPGRGAAMVFIAPLGAELADITYVWTGQRADSGWRLGLIGDRGRLLAGCRPGTRSLDERCTVGKRPGGPRPVQVPLSGRRSIAFEVRCAALVGCSTKPRGRGARLQVYSTAVTVSDGSVPHLSATGGGLWQSRWVSGAQETVFDALDNVGIRSTRFSVDGSLRSEDVRACDYTRVVPCPNVSSARYRLDTRELSDGLHRFSVEAVDAAGNVASAERLLAVDNHAPGRVEGIGVDGGDDWRPANSFTVRWANPGGQASNIVTAHYRLCPAGKGGDCFTGSASGANISQLAGLSVPAPGEYDLRVWLEDEAGNVNQDSASDPVRLRFDDVPPGRAEPRRRHGWLSAADAVSYAQEIGLAMRETTPVSGVKGYSVTLDGTEPDSSAETVGGVYTATELPQGVVTVKARAISGAGVPSPQVGSTQLLVDKTPPSIEAAGAPESDRWQTAPVTISFRGTDQPHLSGMDPSPSGSPDAGGYVAFRLDAAAERRSPGAQADVVVGSDGDHVLTYRAVDVAGNESAERVVQFRLDSTPPEQAAFEPQDPADPRKVTALVSDRTSGLAGGAIEIRRVGAAEWSLLDTTLEGDRLTAYVDDTALGRGIYELRVRARDAAGNERIGDRRRDGAKMELSNPVRAETTITAGFSSGRSSAAPRRRVTVPYGGRSVVRGRLLASSGDGLEGAPVEASARPISVGSEYEHLSSAETDSRGRFRLVLPPGPSRIVRLSYDGDAVNAPSATTVSVRVPAAATLQVNRSFVPNRGRVIFTGRVLGRPLPPGGKLVEIQAYFRSRWRTFDTVKSRAAGRFRLGYRFGPSAGVVRYFFRARLPREAAYPYEEGFSRTRAVTVRGR